MKSSTYYFHMKTKILADFQICISVPLMKILNEDDKRQDYHHIETSQLVFSANQLTDFYIMATLALNGLRGVLRL